MRDILKNVEDYMAPTPKEQMTDLLWEACGLLSIEMRDHRDNAIHDREKRQRIARLLEGFIKKVSKAMGDDTLAA